MTIPTHDFKECLARSHSYAGAPWWEQVYRKAFCGFASMQDIPADGWAQRGGIDRVVILKSGKTLTIDEKVREKDWPDILLERWSDRDKEKPGWVQKPLACDYIAYAMAPSRKCFLLPFQQLQMAWVRHGKAWIQKYKPVVALNRTYTTESIPVPIPVLYDALVGVMCIQWDA